MQQRMLPVVSGSAITKDYCKTHASDPAKVPVLQWSVQELSGDAVYYRTEYASVTSTTL